MPKPRIRTGMPSVELSRDEFTKRFRERFYDPSFAAVSIEIERISEVAWKNYIEYHKSPRTRRAGARFSDPDFRLPVEWLQTRKTIAQAEARQKNARSKSRILLVNGSSRSDQTCPGEMSKTYRLTKIAERIIAGTTGFEVDLLDLRAGQLRSMEEPFTLAKHASRPPCRYVTGPAPAIQTTPWDKSTIGWRKSIRAGRRRMV